MGKIGLYVAILVLFTGIEVVNAQSSQPIETPNMDIPIKPAPPLINLNDTPCPNGFEIYPDSGLCSKFGGHVEAEQNYYHCSLNNYQLALRNGELEAKCGYGVPSAKVCIDQGSIKDGQGGYLWKPEGDPKARCAGGTTILLAKDQTATEIELLDANQNVIFKPSYFGKLADGRPRFCAEGRPGSSFSGPLLVKYGENCKTVTNPANRED